MAQMKVNAMSFGLMLRMLVDGPHTAHELAEETGLHYVTVSRYMREMHRAGAVYVSAWDQDVMGRDRIKVYSLGRKRDVKARKMTPTERQRAYKRRLAERAQLHMMAGISGARHD